jgi:hypothetical protein
MRVEVIHPHEIVTLVTGDRVWDNLETVVTVFSGFEPNTVVVHGYAKGADTVADVVAQEMGFRVVRCPAHWRHNERKVVEVWGPCPIDCTQVIGRPAGNIRNRWMLDNYHPGSVVGFHDHIMNSKGTKDMLTYAQQKNVPTILYNSKGERFFDPPLTKRTRQANLRTVAESDLFFDFS